MKTLRKKVKIVAAWLQLKTLPMELVLPIGTLSISSLYTPSNLSEQISSSKQNICNYISFTISTSATGNKNSPFLLQHFQDLIRESNQVFYE